jgi:hypothetical protein
MKLAPKSQVVEELKRVIYDWSRQYGLTDEQVVTYMAMVSAGYAERAYVTLPHQEPPRSIARDPN